MANAYQTFDLVKTNDVLVTILCGYLGSSCLTINVNFDVGTLFDLHCFNFFSIKWLMFTRRLIGFVN